MQEEFYTVIGTKDGEEKILKTGLSFKRAMKFADKKRGEFENVSLSQEHEVYDKPKNFLIVSDANMMLEETKMLLDRPLKFKEQFVFLGNFICAREGFYDYMKYLCKLRKKRNCLFVKGKNEHNLLAYITGGNELIGSLQETLVLIDAIECSLGFSVHELEKRFPDFYNILSSAVDFYENEQYIFTSAGIRLGLETWKTTPFEELFQPTEQFLLEKNQTTKRIVFGSIPVQVLNQTEVVYPWFNKGRDKIGINGNCVEGGKLLGFLIHDNIPSFLGIRNVATRKKPVNIY